MKTTVDLPSDRVIAPRGPIRWVTAPGGIPVDLDIGDREARHEWVRQQRRRSER